MTITRKARCHLIDCLSWLHLHLTRSCVDAVRDFCFYRDQDLAPANYHTHLGKGHLRLKMMNQMTEHHFLKDCAYTCRKRPRPSRHSKLSAHQSCCNQEILKQSKLVCHYDKQWNRMELTPTES